MKSLLRLLFSAIGFGTAGAMMYFLDPRALDGVGFALFYIALLAGLANLFLLARFSALQAWLLGFLITIFLLLQQARIFRFWIGIALVLIIVLAERFISPARD